MIESFKHISTIYTKSQPIGSSSHLSSNDIIQKTIGINSDHAEDQKSAAKIFIGLCQLVWMISLGEDEVNAMDKESHAQFEETAQQAAVDESGGRDAWQLLDKADCVQWTEINS